MSYLETGSVIEAIKALNPDAEVSVTGNDPDKITWHKGDVIAKDVILAKVTAIQYIEKRRAEYPSIQEQLDMQYWDSVNDTTTWKDAVAKVKSDNPKA